jgi:hypothetical protein
MDKVLWSTITIKVPSEMVELTKSGKVSIKRTLTKSMNVSKSQKTPSIKLVASNVTKPEIVNTGKVWNVDELKTVMKKANALEKKNKDKPKLFGKKQPIPKEAPAPVPKAPKAPKAPQASKTQSMSPEELKATILSIFPDVMNKQYQREYSDIKQFPPHISAEIQRGELELKELMKKKKKTQEEKDAIEELKQDISDNKDNLTMIQDKIARYEALFIDGKEPNIIIKR